MRSSPLLLDFGSWILESEIGRRLEISFVDYWLESVRKIINTRFILKSIFLTNILKLFVNYFFKIYRFLFTRCMYMFRIYKASKWIWTSLKFYWIISLYIFIFPSVRQESTRQEYMSFHELYEINLASIFSCISKLTIVRAWRIDYRAGWKWVALGRDTTFSVIFSLLAVTSAGGLKVTVDSWIYTHTWSRQDFIRPLVDIAPA